MTSLAPYPKFRHTSLTGVPSANYKLFTYAAGTLTPLATYKDSSLSNVNTNPILLNAEGECDLWLTDVKYKLILTDEDGDIMSPIWSVDNVAGNGYVISYIQGLLDSDDGSLMIKHAYSETPAYLQVLSDIINGLPVSAKRFFSPTQNGYLEAGTEFDVTEKLADGLNNVLTSHKMSLFMPAGKYFFPNPITLYMDSELGLRIYGESSAGYFNQDVRGTFLYGQAGVDSLFIFTTSNLATAKGYAFEAHHLSCTSRLVAGAASTGGAVRLFKNLVAGAPARPFNVHHCNATKFQYVIVSDLTDAVALNPSITTGICQVNIENNNFVANSYALYGTGGLGCIMDLAFQRNVSENGGNIYIDGLTGTFSIADNLLEGQTNSIQLLAGHANGEIARNYFESNSGYIYRFIATNGNSSIESKDNYYENCSGALVTVQNSLWKNDDDYEQFGIIAGGIYTHSKSRVGNQAVLRASESQLLPSGIIFLDYHSVPMNTSVNPATLTNQTYFSMGGGTEFTPLGTCEVNTISGVFPVQSTSIPLSTGDWFVAMCLARKKSANAKIYLSVYTNGGSALVNADTSQTLRGAAIGEWVFMLQYVQAPSSSGGNCKFTFISVDGDVDITKPYLYKVSGAGGSSALYTFLPNP